MKNIPEKAKEDQFKLWTLALLKRGRWFTCNRFTINGLVSYAFDFVWGDKPSSHCLEAAQAPCGERTEFMQLLYQGTKHQTFARALLSEVVTKFYQAGTSQTQD